MSTEIIDIISDFALENKKILCLFHQEIKLNKNELGIGYVNNFSTKEYSNYVKNKKNKYLHLCRDHSGPLLKDIEKKISFNESLEKTKESLREDIINDFKLLHIDTSHVKKKYKVAEDLISFCDTIASKFKKKIFYEFGTEDHGTKVAIKKFKDDAVFFLIKIRCF